MQIVVHHNYPIEGESFTDIIETDKLPSDVKLKVEQAVLVHLDKLELPVDVMQKDVYDAGGLATFPMMIMGKLNLEAV